jgi:hypothetical protein
MDDMGLWSRVVVGFDAIAFEPARGAAAQRR